MDESEREEYDFMDEELEHAVESHKAILLKFKRIIWPTYEQYGFTFPEALIFYKLVGLDNTIWNSSRQPPEEWEQDASS